LPAGIYAATRSTALTMGFLAGGVLIDVDHLIDYAMHSRFRYGIGEFCQRCYDRRLAHATLIFHGWEYLVLLAALAATNDGNPWIVGLLLGMGIHLVCDQVTNKPYPMSYFILWRLGHRFRMEKVFPPLEK
jgi:hypothetical protein